MCHYNWSPRSCDLTSCIFLIWYNVDVRSTPKTTKMEILRQPLCDLVMQHFMKRIWFCKRTSSGSHLPFIIFYVMYVKKQYFNMVFISRDREVIIYTSLSAQAYQITLHTLKPISYSHLETTFLARIFFRNNNLLVFWKFHSLVDWSNACYLKLI